MSTGVITQRVASASPLLKARIAGACQVLEGLTATFGAVIVPGRLVVAGNAAATAVNVLGNERLYWLGFASSIIGVAFHVAWAVLLYQLLNPVNKSLSLLAACVVLVGCAIQGVTCVLFLAPWVVLKGGNSLSAFTPGQLHALALMSFTLNDYAFDVFLVFFGFWCVLTGYLIFKSTFLPRILGVMLTISGLGWIVYLSPSLATQLFPFIAAASALGEIPLELWLIVRGVNVQRWNAQANAAGATS